MITKPPSNTITKPSTAAKPKIQTHKPETHNNTVINKPSQPKTSVYESSINKKPPPKSTITQKKPTEVKKPNNAFNSNTTNSNPKPAVNTGGSKPPISTGSNSFAARMAAIQARMGGKGGASSSTSSNNNGNNTNNKGPSKPIVELCEGNTKRMDINKIIGNLEKEKKKKESSSSSKPVQVKVVSGKGKGIPPPPPPPPPPC